jgi:hypothetical protein
VAIFTQDATDDRKHGERTTRVEVFDWLGNRLADARYLPLPVASMTALVNRQQIKNRERHED